MLPVTNKNGRYATILVTVAYMMAVASLVGPSHAADDVGLPLGQRALDRIAGDHWVVHQQTEGDDQGGDGNLLDIDAQQIQDAEGHRQGDGDGDGHQDGGAPLPKAEPRHQHYQGDRLVERIHEQAEILFHLQAAGRRCAR